MLPHELAARLPHRDFVLLRHYAAHRALPQRRLELYGAQSAWAALRAAGAKDIQQTDFLLDPPPQEPETEEEAIDEMRRALGFPPREQ